MVLFFQIGIVLKKRTIVLRNKTTEAYEQFAPKMGKRKLVLGNIDSLQYW